MTLTQQPLPTKPPTRPRWQPARIAAVAAILVVLVVGAVALIGFGGDEPDAAEQATTLPAAETTVPESEPTAPPGTAAPVTTLPAATTVPAEPATLFDGTWTHETSAEPFPRFEMIETSLGFFSRGSGGGVWFSDDGSSFEKVLAMPVGEIIEDAELLPGEPPIYTIEASVHAIVEYDEAVYAFALIADPAHGPGRAVEQVAYRTSNGVDFEEIVFSTDSGTPAVLVGEGEILVIMNGTSVVRSERGTAWTRHALDFMILDSDAAAAFIQGRYLAVAEFEDSDYEWGRRAMVQSVDGIEWSEIPGSSFAYNEFPRWLTPHGGMFYMGGLFFDEEADTGQTGMIFFSEDGDTWQRAGMPAISDLRFVTDLIPTEHGLLAVGWAGWSEQPSRGVLMTTVDGTAFVELPDPDGLFATQMEIHSGIRDGESIVLYGNDSAPELLFHKWTFTPAG